MTEGRVTRLGWLVIAFCVIAAPLRAEQLAQIDDTLFERFADALLQGIDHADQGGPPSTKVQKLLKYLKKKYSDVTGGKVRIAIAPFPEDEVPIRKAVADGFNDRLLAHLIRKAKGRYKFIGRNVLNPIIKDLQQTGALEAAGKNLVAALLKKAAPVDVLVTGSLIEQGDGSHSLSYKAARVLDAREGG